MKRDKEQPTTSTSGLGAGGCPGWSASAHADGT